MFTPEENVYLYKWKKEGLRNSTIAKEMDKPTQAIKDQVNYLKKHIDMDVEK